MIKKVWKTNWKMTLITKPFFGNAPHINPDMALIKGKICGISIESIEEPLMRKIRCLDKMIDELAKGKSMDKILNRQ